MVKVFYQDEYATIELDDSIPCVKLTLDGVPRLSEHYELVQKKEIGTHASGDSQLPKLHMLTDSRTAGPVLEGDVAHFKESSRFLKWKSRRSVSGDRDAEK